jgi:hypothetical protein
VLLKFLGMLLCIGALGLHAQNRTRASYIYSIDRDGCNENWNQTGNCPCLSINPAPGWRTLFNNG